MNGVDDANLFSKIKKTFNRFKFKQRMKLFYKL